MINPISTASIASAPTRMKNPARGQTTIGGTVRGGSADDIGGGICGAEKGGEDSGTDEGATGGGVDAVDHPESLGGGIGAGPASTRGKSAPLPLVSEKPALIIGADTIPAWPELAGGVCGGNEAGAEYAATGAAGAGYGGSGAAIGVAGGRGRSRFIESAIV